MLLGFFAQQDVFVQQGVFLQQGLFMRQRVAAAEALEVEAIVEAELWLCWLVTPTRRGSSWLGAYCCQLWLAVTAGVLLRLCLLAADVCVWRRSLLSGSGFARSEM